MVSVDPRTGDLSLYPGAASRRLEQAMRSRRPQQVSLAGLGLGPVYETLVVELGGDGQPPVQKRQGGGKRDVRRYLLPNGEVKVHLYHQRGWRISDEVVPGVTEERIVPLRDLAQQLMASAAAPPPPPPDRREFLGNFRHPTAEDLEERAANIEREDAAGLLGLWEWCKLPETQDPGSLSPDMWAVYSADNNQEIEQAFRDGAVKASIAIGIRSYEVMFEGALGSGKQVDTRHKKRRFVRRRAVSAEEREAWFVEVFTADGEAAESSAGRIAKMHETALKSDNRCNQLLDEVVLKYSKPGDNKQPGSLARALANSSKMASKFKHYAAEFASIDMLMGKAYEAPSTPLLHGWSGSYPVLCWVCDAMRIPPVRAVVALPSYAGQLRLLLLAWWLGLLLLHLRCELLLPCGSPPA
eukprot:s3877_g3.t1